MGKLLTLVNKLPHDIRKVLIDDMGCNHPNKGFWLGTYTEKGKKDLLIVPGTYGDLLDVRRVKEGRVSPNAPLVTIDGHTFISEPIDIPCGNCVGCRMSRSKQWLIRLVHESAYHEMAYFVTLTYDDQHLSFTKDGSATLVKDEISRFMKRLRTYTGRKFVYFGCGEYGSVTARPHYHLILFGDISLDDQLQLNVFRSKDISDAWKYGLHEVSIADVNCMAYVTGYVLKKQKSIIGDDHDVKPFVAMSKGIGFRYIGRIDPRCPRVYGCFGSGYSANIPRAYMRKMEDLPWMDDYKEEIRKKALTSTYDQAPIYNTFVQDLQGFRKDDALKFYLKERRVEKI